MNEYETVWAEFFGTFWLVLGGAAVRSLSPFPGLGMDCSAFPLRLV